MDEVLRRRLTEQEREEYDKYDRRAMIAANFVVWPGIAGLISYSASRYPSATVCLILVVCAMPFVIILGRRARTLRELAESRYAAIMGHGGTDSPSGRDDGPDPDGGSPGTNTGTKTSTKP